MGARGSSDGEEATIVKTVKREVEARLPTDLALLVMAFAAIPPGDDGAHSNTFRMRSFQCPRRTEGPLSVFQSTSGSVALLGNIAFVTGLCSVCNGAHLLRRDLALEDRWTMVSPSTRFSGSCWVAVSAHSRSAVWATSTGRVAHFAIDDAQSCQTFRISLTSHRKGIWEDLLGIAFHQKQLLVATQVHLTECSSLLVSRWVIPRPGEADSEIARLVANPSTVLLDCGQTWASVALCYDSRHDCCFVAPYGGKLYKVSETTTTILKFRLGEGVLKGVVSHVSAMSISVDSETLYVRDDAAADIHCFSTEHGKLLRRLSRPRKAIALAVHQALDVPFLLTSLALYAWPSES